MSGVQSGISSGIWTIKELGLQLVTFLELWFAQNYSAFLVVNRASTK